MVLVTAKAKTQAVTGLAAMRVASGLSQPVFVTAPPGDYERLFIVQQNGVIRVLNLRVLAETGDLAQALISTPFLDIHTVIQAGGEQGLLGMAFDPNYFTNGSGGKGKFYLYFTVPGGAFNAGVTHISQFQVSANDANVADPTEKILQTTGNPPVALTFDHPQTNHNGGWIGFSPRPADVYNLYIATGDGGGGDDQGTGHHEPGGNAQWNQTLLGKLLRVHVDPATATYTIPANNPFANSTDPLVKKEIWLLGLRNPYRNSFDRLTGRMFIGDVGQSAREEVDVQQPSNPGGGENYGWRDREGTIQNPTYPTPAPTPTPVPPWVNPIFDYPRAQPSPSPSHVVAGRTVIGGYVYRGQQIPALRGTYVFGDYLGPSNGTDKIFTLNYNGVAASNPQSITAQLFPTIDNPPISLSNPSSFGEDANGELYITDISTGSVFRIVPVTPNVQIDSISKDPETHHVMVQVSGVPFKNHTIQGTLSMSQAFTPIMTMKAAGDGIFTFDATSLGKSFYRVVYP